jgi:hypothetical protein
VVSVVSFVIRSINLLLVFLVFLMFLIMMVMLMLMRATIVRAVSRSGVISFGASSGILDLGFNRYLLLMRLVLICMPPVRMFGMLMRVFLVDMFGMLMVSFIVVMPMALIVIMGMGVVGLGLVVMFLGCYLRVCRWGLHHCKSRIISIFVEVGDLCCIWPIIQVASRHGTKLVLK